MDTQLQDKRHEILFRVRLSTRYHSRRRMFFESLNSLITAISVISGSFVFVSVISNSPNLYIAIISSFIITLFSAINLVVNPSKKAREHQDLAKKFITLERDIVRRGEEELTEHTLNMFSSDVSEIELDEPPVLQALNALCYNEIARSDGMEEYMMEVKPYQRILAHFVDINASKLTAPKIKENSS